MNSTKGLTPAEDAELRRLVYLANCGEPSSRVQRVIIDLRERDRREVVREPLEQDLALAIAGPRAGGS